MVNFRMFLLREAALDDIKAMVYGVLGANPKDQSAWDAPLSNFQHVARLLSDPAVKQVVAANPKKGDIEAAVRDAERNGTTVGQLVTLMVVDADRGDNISAAPAAF